MHWLFLFFSWLMSSLGNVYMFVPASVLPRIMDDLSMGPALSIWIMSSAFLGWVLTSFALGMAIDRLGEIQVTVGATAGFIVIGWLGAQFGAWGYFWVLLSTRLLGGMFLAAIWTGLANLVGAVFSLEQQGVALSIFTTSGPAGAAIAQFTGPQVALRYHWSSNLIWPGVACALTLGVILVLLARTTLEKQDTVVPTLEEYVAVVRNPYVLYGSSLAFMAYSLYLFVNGWMPTYLNQEFSISLEVSGLVAAIFPLTGMVSRPCGGLISDYMMGRRRLPVIKGSLLITLPLVTMLAWTRNVGFLLVLLVVSGLVIQLSFGLLYAYVREAVAANVTGTAIAVIGTVGVAGSFSAPVIAGWLIEVSGSYMTAFLYALAMVSVGLVLSWLAPEADTDIA